MLNTKLLIFTIMAISTFPLMAIKLTISKNKAREIFYDRKSMWFSNAYSTCYTILSENDSYPTYNCRIIAEYLSRAGQYAEMRSNVEFEAIPLSQEAQALLNDKKRLEKELKSDPLDQNTILAEQLIILKNKVIDFSNKASDHKKRLSQYSQPYWNNLSDLDKRNLRWALEDGKLCGDIEQEMARIQKDLEI